MTGAMDAQHEALFERVVPASCDTLIVGAGLTGAELAGELERRGCEDVAVLDAGPADDLLHSNVRDDADAALRRWLEPDSDAHFHQPWTSVSPPHYTGSSGLRRRIGGRSLYWYGVVLPVEPWALRSPWWPEEVVRDLTREWNGGPGLYARLAAHLSAWGGPTAATSDEAPAVTLAGLALHRAPRAVRALDDDPTRWYAYSPLDRWRDPQTGALNRRPVGVSVSPCVEVVNVIVRGGVARGVVARHAFDPARTFTIQARRVVLAAGTMGSARLAIQALRQSGLQAQPRLGGLCDHMVQGVFVRLDGVTARRLLSQLPAETYYAGCGEAARSNLFLDVQSLGEDVLIDLQVTGEQLPSPANFVECADAGSPPWPMSVRSTPTTADREVLREQQRILQVALADLLDLVDEPAPALAFDSFDAPTRTNSIVRAQRLRRGRGEAATWSGFLGTEDHEGGTLPLGGVLDATGEFVGIAGLYAVGPQTFPRIGAANVGLTALALTHRLAETLAPPSRPEAWASA